MYDNSKYAYIVGRLRALDTKMLNASVQERLMDAPGASEAFRVLNDLPLVTGNLDDCEVQDFAKVLSESLVSLKELLTQMAPYPEVLDFLWYKYDFHNLKVCLKAKVTGHGYEDISHALTDLGTIDMSVWEAFVLEDGSVPIKDIDKKVAFIKEQYERDGDPQIINSVIDQYFLEVLRGQAERIGSPMITDYLKRMIDFSNLRAFVRTLELKKDQAFLEKFLLEGGSVKPSLFLEAFEKGLDELRAVLEKKLGGEALHSALEKFTEDKTLMATERQIYKLQQEFMSKSNVVSFGPEPVFAFYWKFENHMMILRAILVGKLNGLSNDMISKHVLAL